MLNIGKTLTFVSKNIKNDQNLMNFLKFFNKYALNFSNK